MDELLKIAQVIMFILQIVTLFVLPGYRRQIYKLEEADKENKDEIRQLKSSHHAMCEKLPERFVSREEYLKTSGELFSVLNEIKKVVYQLQGWMKGRMKNGFEE